MLKTMFPNFQKLPRESAHCPLFQRGQIEELHSSERLILASDTKMTHLVRLYLLIVTLDNTPQFYLPVGFEITGQPDQQSHDVLHAGETYPEYMVEFSSMTFDVLVE